MEHLTDIELIDSLTGAGDAVSAHLESCEQCRRRLSQLQSDWELLGQWHVNAEGRDLAPAVLEKARRRPVISFAEDVRGHLKGILKAAAVIAIAVLIGHALGKRPVGTVGQNATGTPDNTYLSAMAMDWSSGLTLSALEDDTGEQGARNGQ